MMCGIIGYRGLKDAPTLVLEGLKTLEYRGYDSWGIVAKTDSLHVHKQIGKIGGVISVPLPACHLAVGHTRWATHGGVTQKNAHPHLSSDSSIAVVHNGIIENYQELRDGLKKRGCSFLSETDTEVIPHLIQEEMRKGRSFQEAVRASLLLLHGNFAIVALHKDLDVLIGARRGSPLVAGIGNKEFFLASDVPAFLEHTKQALYIHDDEMVIIDKGLQIFSIEDNAPILRKPETITWSAQEAKKGEFPHFMLKEIMEQKESILRSLEQEKTALDAFSSALQKASTVMFVACGTAYYASLVGSYLFSKIARKHIIPVIGSEFSHYQNLLSDSTFLIAISQSGETADTLEAVRMAKAKGVKVYSIVNVVGSSLCRESEYVLYTHSGPEIGVASTKVTTGQIALLCLLAHACAKMPGKPLLQDACHKAKGLLEDSSFEKRIITLAQRLKDCSDLYVIGRGTNYPIALEAAHKIKEVSYVHAEGMAGGELKHGTISLISKGTPCIVIVDEQEFGAETLSNAMEIKSRGGYIIGIASRDNEIFDVHIHVPDAGVCSPLISLLPAQLLAYYLAVQRNLDPDKPRNLAKSVTVK